MRRQKNCALSGRFPLKVLKARIQAPFLENPMKLASHVRRFSAVALLMHAAAYQTLAAQPDPSFAFQGQIKQSGAPMNGNVSMTFRLFDSPVGGNQIGATLLFDGSAGNSAPVAVANGQFTTILNFGVDAYAPNEATYLEITAAGQTLSPRQAMTGTPYALNTRGIDVDSGGNANIGGVLTLNGEFGPPGSQPQLLIKSTSNPDRQLFLGYDTDHNDAFIAGIWQGYDWMPVCLNPWYGKVGVGTNSPNCTLQVIGHDELPNFRVSAGPDSIYGSFMSLDGTAQTGGQDWWIFSTANQAAEGQGKLIVKNQSNGAYPFSITSDGRVGINTYNPGSFALSVNGTAANSTGSWSVFSDARLKQNITPLTPGTLDRVLSLHGVEFEYAPDAVKTHNVASGRTVGLIAQDVEKVFPQWVSTDPDGYRYITERGTTALMVESLRELRAEKDAQIAELNARIERLEAALNK
jgi:hypothetical protein